MMVAAEVISLEYIVSAGFAVLQCGCFQASCLLRGRHHTGLDWTDCGETALCSLALWLSWLWTAGTGPPRQPTRPDIGQKNNSRGEERLLVDIIKSRMLSLPSIACSVIEWGILKIENIHPCRVVSSALQSMGTNWSAEGSNEIISTNTKFLRNAIGR